MKSNWKQTTALSHLEFKFSTNFASFWRFLTISWVMEAVRLMISSWNCSENLCFRLALSRSVVAKCSIIALIINSKKNQLDFKALSRSFPDVLKNWKASCSWTNLAFTEKLEKKFVKSFRSVHRKIDDFFVKSYKLLMKFMIELYFDEFFCGMSFSINYNQFIITIASHNQTGSM